MKNADAHRREEAITRRIESFSDIVIGFSLAQTALNFVMPQHAIAFITQPLGIGAFIVTFTVVAQFWWRHSTIFRDYFTPNKPMVALNFIALAAVVLQVYALQLVLHFIQPGMSETDGGVAARIYAGIFAITFGALALLSGLGTFYNWERLDGALRASGVARTIKLACTVIGAAVGTAYASNHVASLTVRVEQHENVRMMALPDQIIVGLVLGIVIGNIIAAAVGRRMRTAAQARA
jgi:hypothetical protein